MKDKDYQKLIEEYEKLHAERADMYPLSVEETYALRRKEVEMVAKKDSDYATKMKALLAMADDGDPLLKLYLAFKKKDMEYLNDMLYENAQMEQICQVLSPGTDHVFFSYNVLPAVLAANLPERIKLILPEENGLADNPVSGAIIINLFMGIWYQNQDFINAGLPQAEKKLGQKINGFEKAYICCLKDIAIKDTEALGTDLEELCRSHAKRKDFGMTAFKKGFCVEAHAIYNLIHWIYNGELEDKVKMPQEKNFCQELAIWQKEHNHQHGKVVTEYPNDLDIFNKMLYCELPKMGLIIEHKKRFIDVDKYAKDVADNLQKMGATVTKKKESIFDKLKKIKK